MQITNRLTPTMPQAHKPAQAHRVGGNYTDLSDKIATLTEVGLRFLKKSLEDSLNNETLNQSDIDIINYNLAQINTRLNIPISSIPQIKPKTFSVESFPDMIARITREVMGS